MVLVYRLCSSFVIPFQSTFFLFGLFLGTDDDDDDEAWLCRATSWKEVVIYMFA